MNEGDKHPSPEKIKILSRFFCGGHFSRGCNAHERTWWLNGFVCGAVQKMSQGEINRRKWETVSFWVVDLVGFFLTLLLLHFANVLFSWKGNEMWPTSNMVVFYHNWWNEWSNLASWWSFMALKKKNVCPLCSGKEDVIGIKRWGLPNLERGRSGH